MITALQNLISGKAGKVFFVLLLLVICVSFVLYLSQGSSVFDFLPSDSRYREDYYGKDLNDPEVYSTLSLMHQVGADIGAVVIPTSKVMEEAENRFYPEVPERNRQEIMNQFMQLRERMPEDMSSEIMQLFTDRMRRTDFLLRNWNFLPRSQRARFMAQEGQNDREFVEGSFKAKVALEHLADTWGFLPQEAISLGVNDKFVRFLIELDPRLASESNRTMAFETVSRNRGVRQDAIEGILYSFFRVNEVEKTLAAAGFALREEAELDLYREGMAWDADGLSFTSDVIEVPEEPFATLTLNSQLKPKDKLTLRVSGKTLQIEFRQSPVEDNSTTVEVILGTDGNLTATRDNLFTAIDKAELAIETVKEGNAALAIYLDEDNLPSSLPSIVRAPGAIDIEVPLRENLELFHEENKNDPLFQEPARTRATAVTFAMSSNLPPVTEPTENRLRQYFENNKEEFAPPAPPPPPPAPLLPEGNSSEGQPGPDGKQGPSGESNATIDGNTTVFADANLSLFTSGNATAITSEANGTSASVDFNSTFAVPEVTFEQVRDEVYERVMEENRGYAEEEGLAISREEAIAFLDDLSKLGNRLRSKYKVYSALRESKEMKDFLSRSGASITKVSFNKSQIGIQGQILGLEKRESETRSGKQPLEEVEALTDRRFFTPSVRRSREGYTVFLLDQKVAPGPGDYANASFRTLYREYRRDLREKAFAVAADSLTKALEDDNASAAASLAEKAVIVSINGKSSEGVRSSYDGRSSRLDSRRQKLETEREEIVKKESGEDNATVTPEETERKNEIDGLLDRLREERGDLNAERALALQVAEQAFDLEIGEGWKELERSEDRVVFARLKGAYVKKLDLGEDQVDRRLQDLGSARAEEGRDRLVADLIVAGSRE